MLRTFGWRVHEGLWSDQSKLLPGYLRLCCFGVGTSDEFQIEEAMISSSSAECADDGMH